MYESKIKKGYSDFPKGMDFLLTYDCNLRCNYCPWWGGNYKSKVKKTYMEISSALNLIDEISSFKPFIRLFGGEPFLHPEWDIIVKYAKEKGIWCTSVTNGTLIYDQAEKIVKSGLLALGVSIDGFTNNLRLKNSAEKIVEGIKKVNALKDYYKIENPLIEIYLTINEENYENLFEFGNYLKELKVNLYRLQHLIWFSKKQYEESLNILKKNIKFSSFFGPEEGYIRDKIYKLDIGILKNQIEKIKKSNFPFKVEFHPELEFDEIYKYYNDIEYRREKNQSCRTMEKFCYISPEGTLFPCVTIEIGNVFEKSFFKVWNSKKARRFRKLIRKIKRLPICGRCPD